MPQRDYHWIPFGKYKGHSVSQTALTVLDSVTGKGSWGYPYLVWFHDNCNKISNGLIQDLSRHRRVLNTFQSMVPCQACNEPNPTLLSLIYGYGSWFANGLYVYHNNKDCRSAIYTENSNLVKIGFDALSHVSSFDKGLQKSSHEVLRYLAGWPQNQRVTDQEAVAFIDKLEKKNKLEVAQDSSIEKRSLEENFDELDPDDWEDV